MIIFRTDASTKTGFGHLKRSVYLASLLKNKSDILFCINNKNDKIVTRFLQENKWSFCTLKQASQMDQLPVKSILYDLRYYTEDDIWLIRRARTNNWTTIQITDLGLCQQEVDYTIDSSFEQINPYSETRDVLKGPDYAILHTKFRHFHKIQRKYRKSIKKVFVCLGGTVQYRYLRQLIDIFSRHHLDIKIAPGFYLKKSALKTLRRLYPGIRFTGKTDNLARSFFEADIALITTGIAAFEAAATGTPALYFYYHDEQKFIAQSLKKKGLGLEISNIDDLLHVNVIEIMNELTLEKRIDMGKQGKLLVDARGVYRIIDFIEKNNLF